MVYNQQQDSGVATVDESSGGWSDDNSSSLWGWLGSIVDGLKSVWETIKDLPEKIADKLKGFFDSLLSGIKGIFVPDTDEMKNQFNDFVGSVSPSSLAQSDADSLGGILDVDSSEPVDITSDISIGKIHFSDMKFLDLKYFKQGVDFFRPIINAFLSWLLGMFYYNQLLSFIGQGGLIAKEAGHSERAKSRKES